MRTVFIGAGDSSWESIEVDNSNPSRYTVYFDGYSGYSRRSSTNVQWAATLFANGSMAICVGSNNALAGVSSRVRS